MGSFVPALTFSEGVLGVFFILGGFWGVVRGKGQV